MAIVQASVKGFLKLGLNPDFKVQSVGTKWSGNGATVAYLMKENQAKLLGLPDYLVSYQMRNFGVCMVHESFLIVS